MPKKIAILNNSKAIGGVEYHICTLIDNLPTVDFQLFLYCCPELVDFYKSELKSQRVEIIPIQMGHFFHISGTPKLIKHLLQNEIKLIHTHLYLASRFAFIPSLVTRADIIETVHIEEKWRKGFKKILLIPNIIIEKLKIVQHICVSKAVKKDCLINKFVSDKKLQLIYNTSRLSGAPKNPSKEITKIGFLGRLENQKRVDLLLRSFAELSRDKPHLELHIGGDGSQMKFLKELSVSLGIEDSIKWYGSCQAKNFYPLIDLYVLPSDFEGFPLGILEAANYELPVVCSNASGNVEIVKDGMGGVFETDNLQELIQKMLYYIEFPQIASLEAKNLSLFSHTEFGIDSFITKTQNVYAKVI